MTSRSAPEALILGPYFSAWDVVPADPGDNVMTLYVDELRVCDKSVDATCNYNSVAPEVANPPGFVTIASAQITTANPNRIHACVSNPGTPPMTGTLGFTYTCSVDNPAITQTTTTASDSCVYMTLNSGTFLSTSVCTITYSQTTGTTRTAMA